MRKGHWRLDKQRHLQLLQRPHPHLQWCLCQKQQLDLQSRLGEDHIHPPGLTRNQLVLVI
jgi:hypothetical protein